MRLPYRIGSILAMGWLIWMFYGYQHYDAVSEEYELFMIIFLTAAGLFIFPAYFLVVYICYAVFKR
ncbi:hypothetical protein [Paenibacillus hexagrammi]|uniref:Uncharacterized protein n=1 Tax=Paenibacillus hexagrammi TaxID=2908839 RepID=A0ABY3SJS1_9BACL|nr:hypothetical protein [Paenibacillus sp. YPD9-1]UJF33630.1 hypothetical protein L0M14_29815 [Paenibacillus sp. YPD9-1]